MPPPISKTTPRPPVAAAASQSAPRKPGTVFTPTPAERATLEAAGWQAGQPVAANTAQIIEDHIASARNIAGILPVDPSTPPLEVTTVAIEHLAPDKRAELAQAMQAMASNEAKRAAAAAAAANRPQPLQLGPGIAEAIQTAQQAPPAQPARAGIPKIALNPVTHNRNPEPAPPPPPPPPPVTEAPIAAPAIDTGMGLGNCPHCGWDLARLDEVDPDDADKYAYIAHVLGAPRFHRAFLLYGGRMVVNFRTPTLVECDLIQKQLAADLAAGAFGGTIEERRMTYLQRMLDYRLVTMIDTVMRDGQPTVAIPSPADCEVRDGDATALPELREYVDNEILIGESVRRFVGYEFHRFQRLAEKLESRANDPSFFEGIDAQR